MIVEFCLAEPNGGTTNHHGKRASRSEVFCRRHLGASDSGKARSEHVWRPCTDPRANGGRVDRYYDPTTDQFMSVDPEVMQTGQPYAYDLDDPLNVTDPLGLCFVVCSVVHFVEHTVKKAIKVVKKVAKKVAHAAVLTAKFVKNHPQYLAAALAISATIASGGLATGLAVAAVAASGAAAGNDIANGRYTDAALDIVGGLTGTAAIGLGAEAAAESATAAEEFANPASSILSQDAAYTASSASTVNRAGLYISGGSLLTSALFGNRIPGD